MSADAAPALRRLFVGSYTDGADRGGIRTIAFDESGDEAHVVRADGCGANPTYLAQRGSLLFRRITSWTPAGGWPPTPSSRTAR